MRGLFESGGPLSLGGYPIQPLEKHGYEIPFGESDTAQIPQTVNVVCTIELFPQVIDPTTKKRKYAIPLPALADHLPGAQYAPKAFASVICRVREGDKSFTVLYFKSGKCLVVRQKCPEHARYVSHVIRLMLQHAPILVRESDGSIRHDFLGKYIDVKQWRIENIVISGNLGMRINLAQLAASAPGKIKYAPGSFPGAEFVMRIRDASTCTCVKKTKCGCKVTVVCFDSGKINIAGLRNNTDGNAIFYTLKSLISDYRDDQSIVPKEQRYETRILKFAEYLTKNAEQRIQKSITTKKRKTAPNEEEEEDDEEEEIDDVELIKLMHEQEEDGGYVEEPETVRDLLMKACEKKQVTNVKILLENDLEDPWALNEEGKTVLDRYKELQGDDLEPDDQIVALLEVHMKRREK